MWLKVDLCELTNTMAAGKLDKQHAGAAPPEQAAALATQLPGMPVSLGPVTSMNC